MQSLYLVYSYTPIFGVDFVNEEAPPDIGKLIQPKADEDTQLIDEQEDSHAIAAYYSQSGMGDNADKFDNIQYDASLGLAVETLAAGLSLEQLWRVM